ncbi:uncharacterized protein KD926_003866 [Aspergillus affinis]|uniref:uncharacterized protein n=1 Tax=Aspergillus affinis TaxID=1070780 RepID=UPI0022FE3E4F|nr:uncharacterized protein KD926_003866 [Aspergillus affinis]KAI9043336.1 hypothetical protein KD926_003866 [Aspergillus affinis]
MAKPMTLSCNASVQKSHPTIGDHIGGATDKQLRLVDGQTPAKFGDPDLTLIRHPPSLKSQESHRMSLPDYIAWSYYFHMVGDRARRNKMRRADILALETSLSTSTRCNQGGGPPPRGVTDDAVFASPAFLQSLLPVSNAADVDGGLEDAPTLHDRERHIN